MRKIHFDVLTYVNVDRSLMQPTVRAYCELKDKHSGCIVLLRVGDFYEAMFQDAVLVSEFLELVLTSKNCGDTLGRCPLVGMPYHAIDRYVGYLKNACYQVIVVN